MAVLKVDFTYMFLVVRKPADITPEGTRLVVLLPSGLAEDGTPRHRLHTTTISFLTDAGEKQLTLSPTTDVTIYGGTSTSKVVAATNNCVRPDRGRILHLKNVPHLPNESALVRKEVWNSHGEGRKQLNARIHLPDGTITALAPESNIIPSTLYSIQPRGVCGPHTQCVTDRAQITSDLPATGFSLEVTDPKGGKTTYALQPESPDGPFVVHVTNDDEEHSASNPEELEDYRILYELTKHRGNGWHVPVENPTFLTYLRRLLRPISRLLRSLGGDGFLAGDRLLGKIAAKFGILSSGEMQPICGGGEGCGEESEEPCD